MANEIETVVADEEIADVPDTVEGEEDTTDYKALAAKNAGIAKRYKTKFEKSKLQIKVEKGVEKELEKVDNIKTDYAKLAFLAAEGIPQEDRHFVLEEAKTTGKDLETLLGYQYFKEELKGRKDAREVKNALPGSSKRSAPSSRDSVEYHLAKDTKLSDIPDVKLRRAVLHAKVEQSRTAGKFSRQ